MMVFPLSGQPSNCSSRRCNFGAAIFRGLDCGQLMDIGRDRGAIQVGSLGRLQHPLARDRWPGDLLSRMI